MGSEPTIHLAPRTARPPYLASHAIWSAAPLRSNHDLTSAPGHMSMAESTAAATMDPGTRKQMIQRIDQMLSSEDVNPPRARSNAVSPRKITVTSRPSRRQRLASRINAGPCPCQSRENPPSRLMNTSRFGSSVVTIQQHDTNSTIPSPSRPSPGVASSTGRPNARHETMPPMPATIAAGTISQTMAEIGALTAASARNSFPTVKTPARSKLMMFPKTSTATSRNPSNRPPFS